MLRRQANALITHKGLPKETPPKEWEEEIMRRIKQPLEDGKPHKLNTVLSTIDRVSRKVIRKHLRAGLTKEEILALPGVQASLKAMPQIASLHRHRTIQVRHEARHAQLALAFLRQRDYSKTEDKSKSYPAWEKIIEIAKRFTKEDSRNLAQRFEQWKQEGAEFIRGREIITKAHFTQEYRHAI